MKGDTGSSLLNLLSVLTWFSRPKNGVLRSTDKGMLRKWHQLYASRKLPWVGLRCIDHVVLSECCDVAFWSGVRENLKKWPACLAHLYLWL